MSETKDIPDFYTKSSHDSMPSRHESRISKINACEIKTVLVGAFLGLEKGSERHSSDRKARFRAIFEKMAIDIYKQLWRLNLNATLRFVIDLICNLLPA